MIEKRGLHPGGVGIVQAIQGGEVVGALGVVQRAQRAADVGVGDDAAALEPSL